MQFLFGHLVMSPRIHRGIRAAAVNISSGLPILNYTVCHTEITESILLFIEPYWTETLD